MELLRSIIDQLGLNNTFFIQFVLVSISVIILSNFAFNKVLEILVLRDNKTRGAKKRSEELMFEHEGFKKEYDLKWSVYEQKADQLKELGREDFRRRSEEIIKNSKEESTRYLDRKRQEMQEEVNKERAKLDKEAAVLVAKIKGKLFEGAYKQK